MVLFGCVLEAITCVVRNRDRVIRCKNVSAIVKLDYNILSDGNLKVEKVAHVVLVRHARLLGIELIVARLWVLEQVIADLNLEVVPVNRVQFQLAR